VEGVTGAIVRGSMKKDMAATCALNHLAEIYGSRMVITIDGEVYDGTLDCFTKMANKRVDEEIAESRSRGQGEAHGD